MYVQKNEQLVKIDKGFAVEQAERDICNPTDGYNTLKIFIMYVVFFTNNYN